MCNPFYEPLYEEPSLHHTRDSTLTITAAVEIGLNSVMCIVWFWPEFLIVSEYAYKQEMFPETEVEAISAFSYLLPADNMVCSYSFSPEHALFS